jgi:hypothetical protein
MGVGPAKRLVIHLVELHAPCLRGPEPPHQMLHPCLLDRRRVGDMVGQNVGIQQLRPVGRDAVAANIPIGKQIRVGRLLRAIGLDRKTAGIGGAAIDIRNDRNGQQRLALRRLVRQHQRVRPAARRRIGNPAAADEIPVKPRIAAIDLPIIPRRAIPAPPQHRQPRRRLKARRHPVLGHAINIRADRMMPGRDIDTDQRPHRLRRGRRHPQHQHPKATV